jgi:hypothetical protein
VGKNDVLDQALAAFSVPYADQNEKTTPRSNVDLRRKGQGGQRKSKASRVALKKTMEQERGTVLHAGLRAPRAGAIAGIVFSILLII